jgi:hypothetical protein
MCEKYDLIDPHEEALIELSIQIAEELNED